MAIVVTLVPSFARAQSSIAGAVADTSGAVLPGVTVEATSPALIDKVRTAVSDSDGRYRLVDLRPGTYVVKFSLAGFATFVRESLEVEANAAVPLNALLAVGQVEVAVTVSGASPVVDVQQAATRQVISRVLMDALPTSRNYLSVGQVVPGMKLSRPDMGGVNAFSPPGLASRGKGDSSAEVDGVDIRQAQGGTQNYTNMGMVGEVTVQTNASTADTISGGIRINMIPKDGGNVFHFENYLGGMNGKWQSNNLTPALMAAGLPTPDATRYLIDVNPAAGGPILRDRFWYFGSGRVNRMQLAPAGARYGDGSPGYNSASADSVPSVKLTWQATQKNKVVAFYDQSNVGTALTEWGRSTVKHPPTFRYYTSYVKWTAIPSSKVMIETSLAPDHEVVRAPEILIRGRNETA